MLVESLKTDMCPKIPPIWKYDIFFMDIFLEASIIMEYISFCDADVKFIWPRIISQIGAIAILQKLSIGIIISANKVFGNIIVLASPPCPPVDPDDVNALTLKI